MTQRELARRLGVHETTVHRLVKGEIQMTVETLMAISEHVDVPPERLIRGDLPDQKAAV